MFKYVSYLFVILIFASIAACGGKKSTAATSIYDLPPTLAPASSKMGGAVQGGPIAAKFSNYSISTLAGTSGTAGFSNYSTINGPPAKLNHPTGITTDGLNYYVADYGNNSIRQITPSGTVTTLQCTDADTGVTVGFYLPSSITTDGTNLYVVNSGYNTISFIDLATKKVTTIGSTTGLSGSVDSAVKTDVRFNQPTGITTDGVNVYVTDSGNQTVRRINIASKAVSTLAGTSGEIGSDDGIQSGARFNLPGRITTDGVNLYLTDVNNRTVRKIALLTGTVTTLAGRPGPQGTADGIGTEARFNQPNGITMDGTYLYVTDSYQNTIRKINLLTSAVTTMSIPDSTLHTPIGITTDGSSLLVADTLILNNDRTYTYSNCIIRIQ